MFIIGEYEDNIIDSIKLTVKKIKEYILFLFLINFELINTFLDKRTNTITKKKIRFLKYTSQ